MGIVESVIGNDVGAVELFLNSGGDPNFDMLGQSLLIVAAALGRPQIVKLLIDRGARVNQIDHVGCNALHHAAWGGDLESMQILLAAGISPNVIDMHQNTPLQRALLSHYMDARMPMLKLLMEHGADPDLSGPGRRTPRSFVRDVIRDLDALAVIEQFKPL
jgi:ankyrin repeat protein